MIVKAKKGSRTFIGRIGENEARQIEFDVSQMQAEFPEAELVMLNRRPSDSASYPVAPAYVEVTSGSLLWTVQSGDLTEVGFGECEIRATQGGHILKDEIYQTWIKTALDDSGEAPDPWESWQQQVADDADRAEAAAQLLENPGAEAVTLAPGSQASASYSEGTFTFGIPQGDTGAAGKDGKDGQDGAPGADGKDGKDGKDGQDGYTPVRGTDYWTAEDQAEIVSAAAAAAAGEIIDDTAGAGDTNKTWSASKSAGEVGSLKSAINGVQTSKQDAPASGAAAGKVLGLTESNNELVPSWVNQPSVPVTDVQVNGVSVLSQGVANVPIAGSGRNLGVVKSAGTGIYINNDGEISTVKATNAQLKAGTVNFQVIVPSTQHESTFYGLAKLAGADMASLSGETVGVYPEAQKVAIQKMLGIYEAPWELIREDTVTNATEADIEITVDGNGNAFELTDIYLLYWTPTQETQASVGNYGKVQNYYDSENSNIFDTNYCGSYTQAANATGKYSISRIEQHNGLLEKTYVANTNINSYGNFRVSGYLTSSGEMIALNKRTYHKILISSVTGKLQYKLYGKRVWT